MNSLYDKLIQYSDSGIYPFHMPGHKRISLMGMPGEIYRGDITEIDGFDNLHAPKGILKDIQLEASSLYGAEETYLLINGSTCGILSAVAAAVGKGGHLLAARNCHKSVYNAALLLELRVTYLYPQTVEDTMIPGSLRGEDIDSFLRNSPDIQAVIVTSPTYEGIVSDIKEIADVVHHYGKILIVDEAHGAHFGFHEDYPDNALKQGADLVVHSLHKTLPAMTQTALLHVSGSRVNRDKLKRYLSIFQTSSPSYVLMASIDSCLQYLRNEGKERLERLLELRTFLDRKSEDWCAMDILGNGTTWNWRMKASDPGKIVVRTVGSNLTGKQLYNSLLTDYGLQMELAGEGYVLAIATVMDTQKGFERLSEALETIGRLSTRRNEKKRTTILKKRNNIIPSVKFSMSQAIEKLFVKLPISDCQGSVSADFIMLYPPGVPLLVPGEVFDGDIIEVIQSYLNLGFEIQGLGNDGYIKAVSEKGD